MNLTKNAMNRMAFGMGEELRPHGITALAISPGWMRTEPVLAAFDTDEAYWQDEEEPVGTTLPECIGCAGR